MSEALKLKSLRSGLEEVEAIPLWGTVPSFPWKQFSQNLSQLFEAIDWNITHRKSEWLEKEDLLLGMGSDPFTQPITLSPIPGHFLWMMPKSDQRQLINLILKVEGKEPSFSEKSLEEGFTQFLSLNILDLFNRSHPFGPLTASLLEEASMPEEGAFAIDVSVQCNDKTLAGRIVCSQETLAAFRTQFAMEKPPLVINETLSELPLSLAIEVGSTTLTDKQWEKVRVGDLIVLDRCTYDTSHHKGTGRLVLGNTPLFDLRIKEGETKILEYAVTQEENPMTEDTPPEDEFPRHEELPPAEEPPISDEKPLEEETPISEEIPQEGSFDEEVAGEEAPLWSAPNGEEKESPLNLPKEIPITLTVEVARVQMPLGKLSQLQPGNVLDLSVAPALSVHLTSNGKRVAKGELIKLGETLGVKILKLGD